MALGAPHFLASSYGLTYSSGATSSPYNHIFPLIRITHGIISQSNNYLGTCILATGILYIYNGKANLYF
jgi:hypothetical protein